MMQCGGGGGGSGSAPEDGYLLNTEHPPTFLTVLRTEIEVQMMMKRGMKKPKVKRKML